jgi:hypothetical protein
MKRLLLLLALFASTSILSACADDPAAPEDPNKGLRSTISAFYAHPDLTLPIYLKIDDSISISALSYGQYANGLAPAGTKKVIFQGQSGTELTSKEGVTINASRSVWAVYSGIGTDDETITISDTIGPAIPAPLAGIRFIHASKNASKTRVVLDVAQGSELTNGAVEYGRSNAVFKPVNVNTTALLMIDESGRTLVNYPLTGVAALEPGKKYTLIMYGNAAQNATSNQITARLIMEPNQ